ncbi:MAG: hypothetical protein K0R65_2323 [Crocinitomicaceae bacterium]|jgi:hypothetical protein|nr:hypothetical protein [Crocinitomicaceae bacterium]
MYGNERNCTNSIVTFCNINYFCNIKGEFLPGCCKNRDY